MKHSSDNPSMDLHHASKGSEVFVGGLPSSVTETKIRELFATSGEIVEVRLIKDHSGKPKGYCFVRFTTKEAASRAVKEKSGFMLEGKKIGVLPSTEQDSLFIGNLRKDWSTDEFDKIVRQVFPDVVSVDLAMSSSCEDSSLVQKRKNRGFAFVKFSSHAAAARAYRIGSKADFVLTGNWHPSVEWAQEEPDVDPEELAKVKVAFIRNLPADADEDYLQKLFEPFGKLEKVVLSKKSRSPVGFVHFDKRSDLENAIKQMNEKTIQGPKRGPEFKIQVEVARPMDKTKKRTHDESQRKPTSKTPGDSYLLYDSSGGNKSKALKLEPPTEEARVIDPYEAAVILLPVAVKERLLRILRLGIATRFDIDIKFIASLSDLPQSAAISVLDQLLISGADKHNKGAYLAGLISKFKVDKVVLNQKPLHLSTAGEITVREPTLPNLFDRVRLPAADSLASSAGRITSRYDIYTHSPVLSRYSPSHLDQPKSHGMDFPRMEEANPAHACRRHVSPVRYSRVGIESHLTPVSPVTYSRVGMDSHLTPAARQPVSPVSYSRVGMDSHLPPAARQPASPVSYSRVGMDSHLPPAVRQPVSPISHSKVGLDPHPAPTARFGWDSHLAPAARGGLDSHLAPATRQSVSQIIYGEVGLDSPHLTSTARQPVSSVSYRKVGLDSHLVHAVPSTSYDRVRLDSHPSPPANSQPSRPENQVRFDPFTGEPYKFDPFTGEPIQPRDLLHRPGSPY